MRSITESEFRERQSHYPASSTKPASLDQSDKLPQNLGQPAEARKLPRMKANVCILAKAKERLAARVLIHVPFRTSCFKVVEIEMLLASIAPMYL